MTDIVKMLENVALDYETRHSLTELCSEAADEIIRLRAERDEALAALENERIKVAGCSTAAFGYWKEGDVLHADYECAAIHDVAALRAERDAARALLKRAYIYVVNSDVRYRQPETLVADIDAALKEAK